MAACLLLLHLLLVSEMIRPSGPPVDPTRMFSEVGEVQGNLGGQATRRRPLTCRQFDEAIKEQRFPAHVLL